MHGGGGGGQAERSEGKQRMFANEKVLLVDGIMTETSWKGRDEEKLLEKCQHRVIKTSFHFILGRG